MPGMRKRAKEQLAALEQMRDHVHGPTPPLMPRTQRDPYEFVSYDGYGYVAAADRAPVIEPEPDPIGEALDAIIGPEPRVGAADGVTIPINWDMAEHMNSMYYSPSQKMMDEWLRNKMNEQVRAIEQEMVGIYNDSIYTEEAASEQGGQDEQ